MDRRIKRAYLLARTCISDMYHLVRTRPGATRLFGPQYRRSRSLLEIDITYKCNLRCHNCNRSCGQAPGEESMTVEQIETFVRDSIGRDVRWKRIRVLGGEPTLHPQLFQILDLLLAYRRQKGNSDCELVLVSNGHGDHVRRRLALVPREVRIENSNKASDRQWFTPFNIAPLDTPLYRHADYSNGCGILTECGMGYTKSGYYPCAVAGGIDRIFDFQMGRQTIPPAADTMIDQLRLFCPLCGHFRFGLPTTRQAMSPTWKAAYARYRERKSTGI